MTTDYDAIERKLRNTIDDRLQFDDGEGQAALNFLLRFVAARARVEGGGVCLWQHGRGCEERKPREDPCAWCLAQAALDAIVAEAEAL